MRVLTTTTDNGQPTTDTDNGKDWFLTRPRYILLPMTPQDQAKQRAAETALSFVQSGMIVGLGTGSTTKYFIEALGAAIKEGRLRDIRGVPTSIRSDELAKKLGIPVATLAECPHNDVTVDGADEVAPDLDLIKGLGGACCARKSSRRRPRRWW